jgi:hypothetical protein
MVGTGLNVTSAGVVSTQIQTVNGKNDQNIVLSATDVSAVPTSAYDSYGGVATLDAPDPNSLVPATDPFVYGRINFWQNTFGTWETMGQWDASANHVIQRDPATPGVTDTNTALLANGMQTIDITYNGDIRSGLLTTVPDYQTVTAEGFVYEVITAGTTSLDGYNQWDVGDLAVCVNGKWKKVTINFTNVVFSAGTF